MERLPCGVVAKKELVSAGGFDTGTSVVKDETGENHEITFWNEYNFREVGRRNRASPLS